MALFRSKSAEFIAPRKEHSVTKQLQEALYTRLDEQEKSAFIEALSSYGAHRDVFELVNALRKILSTPVKRQLFPLIRKVIKPEDVEAFDLVTRGIKHNRTFPHLYRPHMADLNVLNKYRANKRSALTRSWAEPATANYDRRLIQSFYRSGTLPKMGGVNGQNVKLTNQSNGLNKDTEDDLLGIDIGEPDSEGSGYGFSIRGGLEAGVGVYVSSVDIGSPAQRHGLTAGDLIVSANNISFRNISHEEAAKIISASTRLHLTVSRTGRVPNSHVVHEGYSWTDSKGRPVSPPPEWSGSNSEEGDDRRRSATLMLKGSDERKINIVVQKGQGLGIMIRGGKEFGLGVFVSGIDPFSVAENSGMKLGDQILDVNGRSFLDVTHTEAVNHLKTSRHLIITVKDVGKIPVAKTTIDQRGWIQSTRVGSYPNSLSTSSRRSVSGSATDQDKKKKIFSRGVGTQLMLTSSLGKATQREQIHGQAKHFLNQSEHATLNYYLAEYHKNIISIRGLVHALLELLNTPAKFTLVSEIRATLLPKDLGIFDELVAKRDLEKSLNQARRMLAPDVVSLNSYDNDDVIDYEMHKQTMFSHPKIAEREAQWMEPLDFDEIVQDKTSSLMETSWRLTRSTPDLSHLDTGHVRSRSRSRLPRFANHVITSKDNIPTNNTKFNHRLKKNIDDPSDDSGVEINGHALHVDFHERLQGQPFLYKPARPRTSQTTNGKDLSGPQKKILNHLQRKHQTADQRISKQNMNSQVVIKQKSDTIPRVSYHKASTNNKKGSCNFVEHDAEIHKENAHSEDEESDDISDLFALESDQETPSRNPKAFQPANDVGLRSRHKPEHNHWSLSNTKAANSFQDMNQGQEPDTRSQDEKPKFSIINIDSNSQKANSSAQINGEINNPLSNNNSEITHNHSLKYRIKRDKSPFNRIWSTVRPSIANGKTQKDTSQKVNFVNKNQQHEQEQLKNPQDQELTEESHSHLTLTTNQITADQNGTASKSETANRVSKRATFTKARNAQSKELSPTKMAGVTSSRYRSPRREKQISRINVPLIKTDHEPFADLGSRVRQEEEEDNFFTVNQRSGFQKSRVTISDPGVDTNTIVPRSHVNGGDQRTSGNMENNVTTVLVGDSSRHDLSANPIEAIKKKAMEKYGEIPLDVVYIYRSKPTLGVAIEGGANTRQPLPKVISVQPGGSAFESGGLKVGHIILEVNQQPAVGLSHMDAARLIAAAFKDRDQDRIELLVTEWSDKLLDTIKVDVGMLNIK